MPRQAQVAESFFEGTDEHMRASNFRIHYVSDGGSHAIIGGGNGGREVVLAERLPIGRFRVWARPDFSNRMRHSNIRAQARRSLRVAQSMREQGEISSFARGLSDDDIPRRTPRINEYVPEALD
jgi:hypothetical protein